MKRLCAFGNCHNYEAVVTINTGDERPAFCSELHAALWLVGRMKWKGPSGGTRNNPEHEELRSQADSALGEIARLREVADHA